MSHELTPIIRDSIATYIRAGGFAWVAAEALGVPRQLFQSWMRQGLAGDAGTCRDFAIEVLKAKAQARLKAEVQLRDENTLAWLRFGPGRERPGAPGWSDPAPSSMPETEEKSWPELFGALGRLAETLRAYPEAYAAVQAHIDAIVGHDGMGRDCDSSCE